MGVFPIAPLTGRAIHLCIDMQRLFWPGSPWGAPWMEATLPHVAQLVEASPARTVFTRFIPPRGPEQAGGMWRRYYARWREMTLDVLPPDMIDLLPELALFAPPAHIVDKPAYSAFTAPKLLPLLRRLEADALIVSGSESDVCVLSSVLSAVDVGYRVIVARDAICSSSDAGHDNIVDIYQRRYSEQIEVAEVDAILDAWERARAA